MTPKEFYDKVVEMRKAQKEYFRFRAPSALSKSKQLEAEIDAEIKRVEQLLSEKEKARQTSLFGAFDEDLLNRSRTIKGYSMKSYQFEEITFWLSLIACLLANEAKIDWLTRILVVVSIVNFASAIVTAWIDVKRKNKN